MKNLFDLDSPLMRFLNKLTDLLILNIFVILLCIPVITAGAAFTALHFVCLKMIRGEEGYVTKDFFRSFKENFVQATIIWVIALAAIILLILDFKFILDPSFPTQINGTFLLVAVGVVTLLLAFTLQMVFPVLSHFNNTVRGTIKNAFLLSMTILPKTFLMIVAAAIPLVAFEFVSFLQPICFLFFFSAPAYFAAFLYNSTFKKYEPETDVDTNDDFSWSVKVDEDETDGVESIESTEDLPTEDTAVEESAEVEFDSADKGEEVNN